MVRALSARVEIPSGARPEATEAFRRLAAVDGRLGVAELAAELGWSRRHLTEQFSAEYGVGPKELARVLRFERSKRLLTTPERPHAGRHRRRVRVRRPGPHGPGLAGDRRLQPDAVDGRRTAPNRPRRHADRRRMIGP